MRALWGGLCSLAFVADPNTILRHGVFRVLLTYIRKVRDPSRSQHNSYIEWVRFLTHPLDVCANRIDTQPADRHDLVSL